MSRHTIARKSDLVVGRTLWLLLFGEVVQFIVTSKPVGGGLAYIFNTKGCFYGMKYHERELYPSDNGVPGYAYDARRPEIYTSKRAANAAMLQAKLLNDKLYDHLRHR